MFLLRYFYLSAGVYVDGVHNCIGYLLRGVGTQFDIDCAH